MAIRLKSEAVEQLAPRIEQLIKTGHTKKQICERLDIFLGAINKYLRDHASDEIKQISLKNEGF